MSNEKLYLTAVSCPHVIDSNTVTLHFDPKQPGHNALNQLALRLEAALAQQPQGSGEPVATLRRRCFDGLQTYALNPNFRPDESMVWESLPVGDYPLYTTPPSAQQATGSGQVLTDEKVRRALEEVQGMWDVLDRFCKDGEKVTSYQMRHWSAALSTIEALAADTQAQPESREQRLATAMKRFDEHGPLPGMISAFEQQFGQTWTDREWRQEASIWSAAWRAALAAPTTGKREPVMREGCNYLCNAGSVCNKCGHVHGITGEQR